MDTGTQNWIPKDMVGMSFFGICLRIEKESTCIFAFVVWIYISLSSWKAHHLRWEEESRDYYSLALCTLLVWHQQHSNSDCGSHAYLRPEAFRKTRRQQYEKKFEIITFSDLFCFFLSLVAPLSASSRLRFLRTFEAFESRIRTRSKGRVSVKPLPAAFMTTSPEKDRQTASQSSQVSPAGEPGKPKQDTGHRPCQLTSTAHHITSDRSIVRPPLQESPKTDFRSGTNGSVVAIIVWHELRSPSYLLTPTTELPFPSLPSFACRVESSRLGCPTLLLRDMDVDMAMSMITRCWGRICLSISISISTCIGICICIGIAI